MFRIEKIQEIGCCSDYSCSGVLPDDTVFAVIDEESDKPIDFGQDWSEVTCTRGLPIRNYLTGFKRGYEGTGFIDAVSAQEAMDCLISHLSSY